MSDWIMSSPGILGGKPCIRGTRISVEHVLELLASGGTREAILAAYPQVPSEGLDAALEYAAKALRNEVIWEVKVPA
jgi:uncharacterized protein (DUF433 family)